MKFKELMEKRAEKIKRLKEISGKAKEEKRAFEKSEKEEFDKLVGEVKDLDETIKSLKRAENLENEDPEDGEGETTETEEAERRAFEAYIRGEVLETRATNMTLSDNGAVIPSSITNKIIEKVLDICPIYQLTTRYNVGGTLSIPYYDSESGDITMEYATEFTDLESSAGKLKSIELKGFLAGALSKISKSLVNNSNFDIVSYVIKKMAETIAKWIEKELLYGTDAKIEGLKGVKRVVESLSETAITADELIDVQEEVPDQYQHSCIWIMNRKTRTAIRKLKDNDGKYILNKDANSKWGYTLFGNDVFTSANMDEMAAGKTPIYYGDFSGLAVKVSEDMNLEVLREKFATQHAIGVVGWIEMDAKVENGEKISALKMKAGE